MQTMTKTEFNALAQESLIFAQIKAEAVGVTRAQVDLWTGSFKWEWRRDAGTGLILPLHQSPLTKDAAKPASENRVLTRAECGELLPFFLRRQA